MLSFCITAGGANVKDHNTHQITTQILNEEFEHEQDIEDWIGDFERMKEDFRKLRL